MDTISRENNSYLPVAAVIVGLLALVLSGVALAKISSAKKDIATQGEQIAKIEPLESEVHAATATSEKAVAKLTGEVNNAFQQVATEIGSIRGDITKIQESAKAAPVKAAPAKGDKAGAAKEPVTAGADEYIIKGGDTGAKIARAHGVSLGDLQAVNPGTNWTALKVGQKIKLPAKR